MSMGNLIELEKYRGTEIPMDDWNITGVFGDILLCRFVDAMEGPGGEYVMRGGIAVPLDTAKHTWRIVEVMQHGPDCGEIKDGDQLMIPNDRGIPCVLRHGRKVENLIFINTERVFCKVTAKEAPLVEEVDEVKESIVELKQKQLVNTQRPEKYEAIDNVATSIGCADCGKIFNQKEAMVSGGRSYCKDCQKGLTPDPKKINFGKITIN